MQIVLYDNNTLLPAYDSLRGEPRSKIDKATRRTEGDCVDCDQCLAVCPTGVDIREGQQIGCITCGLCIDACDNVMKKLDRPSGLIRYASLNQLHNLKGKSIWKHPQVLLSMAIIFISLSATTYGLNNITEAEMSVIPSRQPTYVIMSDGSVQNRYRVRILNKTNKDHYYRITVTDKENLLQNNQETELLVKSGKTATSDIAIRIPQVNLTQEITPIFLKAYNMDSDSAFEYQTIFMAPVNH